MTDRPAIDTPTSVGGLRRNCVSLIENFAQTLGVLSPAGTISVIIPLLIVGAGNGTWLLLLVTLSIFLAVMLNVLRFASLYSSAGSLAAFSRLGLGRRGGLIGGWIYVFGMLYCIPSALLGAGAYLDMLLTSWFGPATTPLRVGALTVSLILGCWAAAFRGIKLSTNLMLIIECVSVSLMAFLIVAGMVHTGAWIDHAQLRLSGVHASGLQGSLVLAFMLMAGFEGATSLGEESQNPRTAIPKAILTCMLPLTVLYLVMTYCMVSLENRGVISGQVNGLTIPFDNIAHAIHSPWLGPLSSLGVALSYFGCGLGSLTIASRVLYSMARERQFWSIFGEAHHRNATPHRAIALISAVSIAVLVYLLASTDFGFTFNFLTEVASFGLIGAYLMVVAALPLYLHRNALLRGRDVVVAMVAGLSLLLVLLFNLYPIPPPPYSYVGWVFVASVGTGLCISWLLGRRDIRVAASAARGYRST